MSLFLPKIIPITKKLKKVSKYIKKIHFRTKLNSFNFLFKSTTLFKMSINSILLCRFSLLPHTYTNTILTYSYTVILI